VVLRLECKGVDVDANNWRNYLVMLVRLHVEIKSAAEAETCALSCAALRSAWVAGRGRWSVSQSCCHRHSTPSTIGGVGARPGSIDGKVEVVVISGALSDSQRVKTDSVLSRTVQISSLLQDG
jgi:hypothetical protein